MFHHGNISAHAPFGTADVPADGLFNTGTFRHGEFSAQGIFGTRNFRHRDISAPEHFSTWIFWHLAKEYGHFGRHLGTCATVLKHPPADMCRKFLMRKTPHVKTFPCWNVHLPERLQRQMVHLPKCSSDETSMRKWLFPKCFVPKWSSQFKTVQWIT